MLCVAGAGALQYDASALRQALGAAKPLRNGAVVFRREWREKAGDDAAADAVYDALTRGRGPEIVAAADVDRWSNDQKALDAAVTSARLRDDDRPGIQYLADVGVLCSSSPRPRGSCSAGSAAGTAGRSI